MIVTVQDGTSSCPARAGQEASDDIPGFSPAQNVLEGRYTAELLLEKVEHTRKYEYNKKSAQQFGLKEL